MNALLCLFACIAPLPGGAESGDTALVAGSSGTSVATSTAAPVVHAPEADDGTLGAVAPTTRIFPPAGTNFLPNRAAVGDFNGDGAADFAVEVAQDHEVLVWFGPLDSGDLESAAAPAVLLGRDLGLAVDIDSDGTAELTVGNSLVSVPGPGIYDPATVAEMTINGGIQTGAFLDLDSDGNLDLVIPNTFNYPDALWTFYGPLPALVDTSLDAPGSSSAVIRGPTDSCRFPGQVYPLTDLSGDGMPELLVLESIGTWAIGENGGCGVQVPNLIAPGGEYRGQELDLTLAVQTGLDYLLRPASDLDGDDVRDFVNLAGDFYRTADLYRDGTQASPFAWVGPKERLSFDIAGQFHTSHDYSGDGVDEVLVGSGYEWFALSGQEISGELTVGNGKLVDPDFVNFTFVADLTGDGVVDPVAVGAFEIEVYSGAELARRWAMAP